jgi:hypothetical protein
MSGDVDQTNDVPSDDELTAAELTATVQAQQAQIDWLTGQLESLRTATTDEQQRVQQHQQLVDQLANEVEQLRMRSQEDAPVGRNPKEGSARRTPTVAFPQQDPRSWGGELLTDGEGDVDDEPDAPAVTDAPPPRAQALNRLNTTRSGQPQPQQQTAAASRTQQTQPTRSAGTTRAGARQR